MYNSALVVKMLQSDGQIPENTVTKTSTELVPYLGTYEHIPEIKNPKLTRSTKSGISYF